MMMPTEMERELARIEQELAPKPQPRHAGPTGPVTAAGKETVSANSLKHGLCAKKFACLKEEREEFDQHLQSYFDHFSPIGPFERDLTRNLAQNFWRLRRAHQMETALLDLAVIESEEDSLEPALPRALAWADPTQALQRIALYAARIQRAIDKDAAKLEQLQSERKAAYAKAQEEAIALTHLARSQNNSFNPAQYFTSPGRAPIEPGQFVYSAPEIAHLIDRAHRLDQARALQIPSSAAPKGAVI